MPNSRSTRPDDAQYAVEAFKILSDNTLQPEDDPAEWVYPDGAGEEDQLRELAEQIVAHDEALSNILGDAAIGDTPVSELLRRVCAWQAMLGSKMQQAPASRPPKPWLA